MSLLASQFDIQSVDNPVALAALAQVLAVPGGETFNGQGTPVAGTIPPGAIVTMNSSGQAVLATTTNVVSSRLTMQMVFVAIDGNEDFSGSFVQVITVLNGGFTMQTDQFVAGAYTPGMPVSFTAGQIAIAGANDQIIGVVGPAGLNTVNSPNTLQVIIPQGISF